MHSEAENKGINLIKISKRWIFEEEKTLQCKQIANPTKKKKRANAKEIITGTKEIKRIVSNSCTWVYMNTSNNLDETDNFLGK